MCTRTPSCQGIRDTGAAIFVGCRSFSSFAVPRKQPAPSILSITPDSKTGRQQWISVDTAPSVHRRPPTSSRCPFTRVVVHQCPPLSAVICRLRCQKGCQSGVFLLLSRVPATHLEADSIHRDGWPDIFGPSIRKRQNSEEDLAWRPSVGYACGKQPSDEE